MPEAASPGIGGRRTVAGHVILSVLFAFFFLLLNRPEVIIIKDLGFTVWYPAAGLLLAFMVLISPWYGLLGAFCAALAGILIYHQPVLSWSGTVGATAFGGFYAAAARGLRGRWQIDPGLCQRRDVMRYLYLTAIAALGSAGVGAACLAAEHSIPWSDYWSAAFAWFLGDQIGLLAVAPFLLIYLSPWVRAWLLPRPSQPQVRERGPRTTGQSIAWLAEAGAQLLSLPVVAWVEFEVHPGRFDHFYLSFIPIIWMAIRQGVRRVVLGLLVLDFGVAMEMNLVPLTHSEMIKAILLMLVVSAAGLMAGSATDERQSSETKLRSEKAFSDAVIQSLPGMFCLFDSEGRILRRNTNFQDILGYSSDEIARIRVFDAVAEEDRDVVRRSVEEAFKRGLAEAEGHLLTREGKKIPCLFNSVPILLDGRRCIAGVALDISKRKKAEKSLKLFRMLVDQSSDAIEVIDPETLRYIDVNDRACFDLGYTREELLSLSVADVNPSVESLRGTVSDDLEHSGFTMIEAIHRRKDGSVFPVEVAIREVVLDRKYIVTSARDITERQRAEQALRESEKRYHDLVISSHDWIWETDQNGAYTFVGSQCRELLGYLPEELIGKTPFDLMPAEEAERVAAIFASLVAEGKAFRGLENVNLHRDGHEVILETNGVPFSDAAGRLSGYRGMDRDITERKRVEKEMLKAKEAAESANHAKSEFLANMSHEIRTPINGILGMAELVLDTELTPEQREYLLMLRSSAESLMGVINDILDFSKIEARKLDLDPVEFDLHESVDETIRALALRAHQKNLELACSIDPRVPVNVVGDPGRLRQILVNLVGNAIKFTERGEVAVWVQVSSQSEAEIELEFIVTDTGIGIAPEKHAHIFEAFAQADGSTTRNYGGSGLGLAISARLVGMMGGRIWVNSSPGQGSTFHFTTRMSIPGGVTLQPPEQLLQAGLLHVPVIVVDDNATNRKIVLEMASGWGMQAAAAESGETALQKMARAQKAGNCFRLAIIDGQMPDMDGFELAARIKNDPRLAGAVIMMLTSTGKLNDTSRCRALGISAYLLKPIRRSELLSAITTVLGQKSKDNGQTLITRHELPLSERSLRVLLAEDNRVNQMVGLRTLEKMGHTVVLANNGAEAIAALRTQVFDLILMDVQMPVMDGLTASKRIRETEKSIGNHIPIIAMTAHAMLGDRDLCLAAGMDAYIAKPVNRQDLEKCMVAVTAMPAAGPRSERMNVSIPSRPAGWDVSKALERVGGDEKLLREVAGIFLEETAKLMTDLHQALKEGNASRIERIGHSLKGALSYLGAAADKAREVEEMGHKHDLQHLAEAVASLESEITELTTEVGRVVHGEAAGC